LIDAQLLKTTTNAPTIIFDTTFYLVNYINVITISGSIANYKYE